MKHTGKIALFVAFIGAVGVTLMLFGARLGLWEPITGFGLYRTYLNPLGAVILGVGLLALVIHLVRRENRGRSGWRCHARRRGLPVTFDRRDA